MVYHACDLYHEGKEHPVILESLPDILSSGSPSFMINDMMLRDMLANAEIDIHTGVQVKEITKTGILVNEKGTERVIEADTVIYATGFLPESRLQARAG